MGNLVVALKGPHHYSKLLNNMAFGSYNKLYGEVRTEYDWLSRDEAQVDKYVADPLCGFIPSCSLFRDMMTGIKFITNQNNLENMNKDTPVYFMSGDMDPVGECGKGVKLAYDNFKKVGMKDVSIKLYKDGRHEMLNELNVRVVYHSWASNVIVTANRIEHVALETKSGRIAISGKYFIDCTGDGDIFCWAGEPFTERRHHIGAMWRVGHAENSKAGGPTPISGVRIMHTGGEYNQDGLDVFNLSDLQYRLRKYMWDETQKARQAEGCSDLFLLDTPSQIGVRCTRVLSSRHIVTMDETMSRTAYHDVIGMSGGSIGFTHNGQK